MIDRNELFKEIERMEYEKPRLVVWSQLDEFRLQCMKELSQRPADPAWISEPQFYIQDTRGYCGNSVMWWCVDGHGYTSNLAKAWRVSATWKGRDTDKLWPCAEIDTRATRQFDMQFLREISTRRAGLPGSQGEDR